MLVAFFLQPLVQALLAPVVVSPVATCAGGLFPFTHWRTYSTCARATCPVWWWSVVVYIVCYAPQLCNCFLFFAGPYDNYELHFDGIKQICAHKHFNVSGCIHIFAGILLASRIARLGGYMVPASRPFLVYVILPTCPEPLPSLSWGVRIKVHPIGFTLGQVQILLCVMSFLPSPCMRCLKPSNSNGFITLRPSKAWPSSGPSTIFNNVCHQ